MVRGFTPAPTLILALAGIVIVIGAFLYGNRTAPEQNGTVAEHVTIPDAGSMANIPDEKPGTTSHPISAQTPTSAPKPPFLPTLPIVIHLPTSTPTTPATPPATSSPTPTPTPIPAPAWSPGFMADTRVEPYIPTENERAGLPSCDGKSFNLDPIYLASVLSASATGKWSGALGAPADYVVLSLPGGSDLFKYDVVAPADVWITNIVQQFNVTQDDEDTTLYFALCKDIVGYVTNVKELTDPIHKLVTDTSCFGKPQTGPNACKIEILTLIGRGSLIGKAGEIEGKLGFGVIDLRKQRALANPAQYQIQTNFAACPFNYLQGPAGWLAKLDASSELCIKP